jgi:DNA-binding NtrC family response regulator
MLNGKLKILIVDESEKDARELKRLLKHNGSHIDTASNFGGLVTLHSEKEYDIIFMSMSLYARLKDELDCVRTIRAINSETKLILMGNGDFNADLKRAMFDGAYGCIHKPYIEEEIIGLAGLERSQR